MWDLIVSVPDFFSSLNNFFILEKNLQTFFLRMPKEEKNPVCS